MQQAKCTNCGVEFEVDEKQEAVVCKECKKPVIVKDAIEEYKESLEPNAPIIKNQEDLDKTNFRLKFSFIVSIMMITFFSLVFIYNLAHEIVFARLGENELREGVEWLFPVLKIIFSFIILSVQIIYFCNIVSFRNKIKYNKKKRIEATSGLSLVWSVMALVLVIAYFVLALLSLIFVFPEDIMFYYIDFLGLSLQAAYIILLPLLFAVFSVLVFVFHVKIDKKIIKK